MMLLEGSEIQSSCVGSQPLYLKWSLIYAISNEIFYLSAMKFELKKMYVTLVQEGLSNEDNTL